MMIDLDRTKLLGQATRVQARGAKIGDAKMQKAFGPGLASAEEPKSGSAEASAEAK